MIRTFTTTQSWICPANVTQIKIECWGGGSSGYGWGSGHDGQGGGGGAYSRVNTFDVTPGATYAVVVGVDTTFNTTTCVAKGGAAYGVGGAAANGVGDVKYTGGNGSVLWGGGGSSAGPSANGNNGINGYNPGYDPRTPGIGGAAVEGGGKGGDGSVYGTPQAGSFPGGGGGATQAPGMGGGRGGAGGQLILTYITSSPLLTTEAVTDISYNTVTGNGTITDAGTATPTRRGFCYIAGTAGDPTTSDSVAYDDGTFTTGAYTKTISGLIPETAYRVRAYAVNSAGTSYGSTVDVKTLPSSNFFLFFN